MAKMIWLNWSGGGNLPPSLGIARVLSERGHEVSFAGRPEMVPRVNRAGFRAIELKRSYEQAARYPEKWLRNAASYLSSPAVGEELSALEQKEKPDLTIIDAMFPVALVEARRFSPTVVMCHTALYRILQQWRNQLAMIVGLRTEAGFDALPRDLDELWMTHDRLIVTTLSSLDRPSSGGLTHPEKISHVGPVLERELHSGRVDLPWRDDDARPLILVSFSTAPEQGSAAKFQSAIDALANLPVRGVVTVGDSIDPKALRPAENVAVFGTADHDDLMSRAALVVTHGGHGTFMRALTYGLPLVVIPGMAHDQPVNAAAAQDWGVGRALSGDANAKLIRDAVEEVLAAPSFRAAAQSISREIAGADGAAKAAEEIERLLG